MRKNSYLKLVVILLSLIMLIACNPIEKKIFTENDINIIPKPVKTILNEGNFS